MIAVDSNLAIYVLNGHPDFAAGSLRILEKASNDGGCASTLLLAELLQFPAPDDAVAVAQIKEFIQSLGRLTFVPVSQQVARDAASLIRRHRSLRLADAVHLATARTAGADEFWTNDIKLKRIKMTGLRVKLLSEHL